MEYKDFYNIQEFAKKLEVHPNTVRKSIKNGQIAAFKFGTEKKYIYRIPHTEIVRLIELDLRKIVRKQMELERSFSIEKES